MASSCPSGRGASLFSTAPSTTCGPPNGRTLCASGSRRTGLTARLRGPLSWPRLPSGSSPFGSS
eukprot:9563843-Alexandrium_andersonii.AAC.1